MRSFKKIRARVLDLRYEFLSFLGASSPKLFFSFRTPRLTFFFLTFDKFIGKVRIGARVLDICYGLLHVWAEVAQN